MDESEPETPESAFAHCIYQMEMERLKFTFQSYLKCRLAKVPISKRVLFIEIIRLKSIGFFIRDSQGKN